MKRIKENKAKHLILDIGGVLVKKCGAAAVAGVTEKKFQLWISFNKLDESANLGKISPSRYLKEFNELAGTNYNLSDYERARRKIIEFNNPLIAYCKKNRGKFKTSILSDNNWVMDRFYNRYIHLNKWTRFRVYSYAYGIEKPDRRIYKILLNKLKARPQDCIFVDNCKKNIDTAKKMGLKTILYKNNKELFPMLERFFG